MTNGPDDVKRHVRNYIEENFLYLRPGVELGDADGLLDLGILDSLGFVELVEEVQARYDITVDDIEITDENFGSINSIVRYVEVKRTG